MGFNPAQPRDPTGKFAGGGRSSGGKGRPASRTAGGGKSLSAIAKKAGISEAKLVQLNPGLKGLVGTGAHVPNGTTLATTKAGEKVAAKSQASGKVGKSIQHMTAKHAAERKAAAKAPTTKTAPVKASKLSTTKTSKAPAAKKGK